MKRSSNVFPIWAIIAFSLLICMGAATGAEAALITTDASDYPPGDTVWISGSGFSVGETVTLQVSHDDGTPLPGSGLGHDPWDVTANGSGEVSSFWVIPLDDNLDETLLLEATGQTSGLYAFTTFTDANTVLTLTEGILY